MGKYIEVANTPFGYFTKANIYEVFDRPDKPQALPYPSMRQPATCHLRVLRRETHTVVIATEIPDNPGASVTNAASDLATKAVRDFSLNPRRTQFIEHYTPDSYGERNPHDPETYDEVTFTWADTTATNPTWRRLQPHEIAEFRDSK